MAQLAELIGAWATESGLEVTDPIRRLGSRRAHALGRLAFAWRLLGLPWVVSVQSWEFGHDNMPKGTLMAFMRVRAADAVQVQRLAAQVHGIVARFEKESGLRVVVCVQRATRRDRLRAWASWRLRRD